MGYPVKANPHVIYDFLIQAIREEDQLRGNTLVQRWLQAAQDEFDSAYTRIQGLQDLMNPETCPAAALDYLRWLVGFTKTLDNVVGEASEVELRRLISTAARFWKKKGTPAGFYDLLVTFTRRPVRILDWFFFRILVDEVELGKAELDVDPWLLDQPGMSPSVPPDDVIGHLMPYYLTFELTSLLGVTEAVPHSIRVQYVPNHEIRTGMSFWNGSKNVVIIADYFGVASPGPGTNEGNYRVGVDPDEFVTDFRIMDDPDVNLNRNLLEAMVGALRPAGERIWIRYLDMIDDFKGKVNWTTVSGFATYYPDAGYVLLTHGGQTSVIKSAFTGDTNWGPDIQAMCQFKLTYGTTGKWFEMRFFYTDESNYYAIYVDPYTKNFLLQKMVGGSPSTLIANLMPTFHLNTWYVIRVISEDVGSARWFKIFLDDNYMGMMGDTVHTAGKLAFATAAGQYAYVTYAELFESPLQSTRLGPS